MLSGYMIVMLILFMNFFIHEYVTRSNDAKRRKQKLEQTQKTSTDELSPTKSSRQNGINKKHK
jgi:hypothetical protein